MSIREDQVNQAVKFLCDQRTQGASAADKESFLRHKGLTDTEISTAMQRVSSTPIVGGFLPPPSINMGEPILWSAIKSIFSALGAMAIGVIGYHAYRDSRTTAQEPSASVAPTAQGGVSMTSDTEERILDALKQMKAEQALRHHEILQKIRELSDAVSVDVKKVPLRKPGGSVVLDTSGDIPEALAPHVATAELKFDIEKSVAELIDAGLDSTLMLILSNLDKNRKLNKLNSRFVKLTGSPILIYCGFVEGNEFFELPETASALGNARALEVVQEIKRQKAASDIKPHDVDSIDADGTAQPKSGTPLPPWLATPSLDTNLDSSKEVVSVSEA